MTPKNRTLEGKNRTLGGDGGLEMTQKHRTSFMHVPLVKFCCHLVAHQHGNNVAEATSLQSGIVHSYSKTFNPRKIVSGDLSKTSLHMFNPTRVVSGYLTNLVPQLNFAVIQLRASMATTLPRLREFSIAVWQHRQQLDVYWMFLALFL